jgi:hypothetical protein
VPFDRAMNGIGVAHWRCTDCGRRFVLTHVAPDHFTPVFLDPGVRSVEPRETGLAPKKTNLKNPVPPPAIDFDCRCGKPVTVHSFSYNGTVTCPSCGVAAYAAVKYNLKTKEFVIRPGYARSGD